MYTMRKDIVLSAFGDEVALMDPLSGHYYVINEIGKDILDANEKMSCLEDVVKYIHSMYDVTEEKCTESITTFINQLVDNGIMVVK